MQYDLELDRVVRAVKKEKAKRVCVQLPDGLKPEAGKIADTIESSTGAIVLIWAGSCFGACDTPNGLGLFNVDMLVQWGHKPWD